MADNFQRVGTISNAHVGRNFATVAAQVLAGHGLEVEREFSVAVGIGQTKKDHSFDLGSKEPPVLVECKSHRWTAGGNVPSAKLTVWNEAMYYFLAAPRHYRNILFVLRDTRVRTGETLAQYYIRTYVHLIPNGVEIWEYDEAAGSVKVVHGA